MTADPVDAINMQGALALQRGDAEGARSHFERAVRMAPSSPDSHNNLGVALQQLHRWDEALAAFSRAVAIDPSFSDAWFNRGVIAGALGRWDEALASYGRALQIQPRNPRYLNNAGNALQKMRRWNDALGAYQAAIAARPDYVEALVNRGVVLRELRRREEAVASFDAALALRPDHAEAWNNRAVALRELNRWEESAASARRALGLKPGYPEALNNLGFALHDLGRFEESRAAYEQALAARPGYPEAQWNLALLHLLLGDYRRGWELFEARWKTEDIAPFERRFAQPLWLGRESLEGRTILVHAEQGLGDMIQFSRFLEPLARRAGHVIFEAPRVLAPLMAASFPPVEVVEVHTNRSPFDCHTPLASLPLAFATTLETIPGGSAYLHPGEEARRKWRGKLRPRTRPRIGLAWAGNPAQRNDHNRSMPFERLLPLLELDLEFHSLQKAVPERDRAALAQRGDLVAWGDELADFSDTAALVLELDLVISVDTSAAHLSGALGQRTWIPLAWRADYRYLLDRDDSPWYPTARLFRQPRPGAWDEVVARIKAELLAAKWEPSH